MTGVGTEGGDEGEEGRRKKEEKKLAREDGPIEDSTRGPRGPKNRGSLQPFQRGRGTVACPLQPR